MSKARPSANQQRAAGSEQQCVLASVCGAQPCHRLAASGRRGADSRPRRRPVSSGRHDSAPAPTCAVASLLPFGPRRGARVACTTGAAGTLAHWLRWSLALALLAACRRPWHTSALACRPVLVRHSAAPSLYLRKTGAPARPMAPPALDPAPVFITAAQPAAYNNTSHPASHSPSQPPPRPPSSSTQLPYLCLRTSAILLPSSHHTPSSTVCSSRTVDCLEPCQLLLCSTLPSSTSPDFRTGLPYRLVLIYVIFFL